MKPKPVEHSRPPAYPTRREVLAGTASFALVNLTGYSFVSAEAKAGEIFVAPIFEHGEGRGATGCIVVSPPVFLSEEEAMQIVKEELANHGVQLAPGPVLKDLIIAPRVMQQVEEDETSRKIVQLDKFFDKAAAPLRVTAMDEKKSIAIEFVCEKNYSKLGGVCRGDVFVVDRDGHISASITRSVTNFDYKDAAQYTATEIRQKARQRLYVGVLYDPLTRVTSVPRAESSKTRGNRRSARDKATAESKELLRRQAQDFVAWLKRQGAI